MAIDALANYKPEVVEEASQPLVYFATVGTFNQKDKEGSTLLIHKSDMDNMEQSTWAALGERLDSEGNRRPLIVVYDEAQNLSDQQTDLLMELEPDGFLVASATMRLPTKIGTEIGYIKTAGYPESELITTVKTPDVVKAGLVKSTVNLEGYNTPMEEAVAQLLADMTSATDEAKALGLEFTPKAIYVCNTNVVANTPNQIDSPKQPFTQRQAPPILIWRYLTEQMGVDPAKVAVYADLKTDKDFPLPDDFVLFRGSDKDYEDFTAGDYEHVVFNLTLQEGWDDPSVYFAYIDKSMESTVQITQVVGRVLRQPGANHYPSDRLNSAHFYVRVDKNSVFNDVMEDVQRQLGDDESGIRIIVSKPGATKPDQLMPKVTMTVPETGSDSSQARGAIATQLDGFADYRSDSVNTKGAGSRRVLRQKVGESGQAEGWEEYQHSAEASARWVFHREIQRQFKEALGVVNLADKKLDAIVGIGSAAHKQVIRLAEDVVAAYVKGVRLVQRRSNPFTVGSLMTRPDELIKYNNAVHEGYSGLNGDEKAFAAAIDATDLTWARNPVGSGYKIPLITVGPTSFFYPDFLVWTEEQVILVDTKGQHLIRETAARKMLRIKPASTGPRIDVQFVSVGRYDDNLNQTSQEGYTAWGLADDGSVNVMSFDDLDALIKYLVDDSLHK